MSIPACHAGDQGSIPCRGALLGEKPKTIWVPWKQVGSTVTHALQSFVLEVAKVLPDRESNPGLPRDRRGYSPLYYRGSSEVDFAREMRSTEELPHLLGIAKNGQCGGRTHDIRVISTTL